MLQCLSPDGCKQAVRVVLRSGRNGNPGGYSLDPDNACPTITAPYYDVDGESYPLSLQACNIFGAY